jgi:hypothetical protein
MDLPSEDNELLIDELVQLADYDLRFDLMKDSIVKQYAQKNNWTKEKIESVKEKIRYQDVPNWILQNGYVYETTEELLELIEFHKSLPKEESTKKFNLHKQIILDNFENNIHRACEK